MEPELGSASATVMVLNGGVGAHHDALEIGEMTQQARRAADMAQAGLAAAEVMAGLERRRRELAEAESAELRAELMASLGASYRKVNRSS